MAREKFQTLTEQMFYILLSLQSECYGMDIMDKVRMMTDNRILVGPGTLYHLLESFLKAGLIEETRVIGRKRCYMLTYDGKELLHTEYIRLQKLTLDYEQYIKQEGNRTDEE